MNVQVLSTVDSYDCTCIGPESMLTLTYGVVPSLKKWGQLHLHLSFSLGIGFIVENISLH